MSDVNLSSLVTEVLDESDSTDIHVLAGLVADKVPDDQLRAALAASLVQFVRMQIGIRRASNPLLSNDLVPPEKESKPNRSTKVIGIREMWKSALRDRINVSDGYKFLGECSYDDLIYAADQRETLAASHAAKAARFRSLAEQLKLNNVSKVSELPETILAEELE